MQINTFRPNSLTKSRLIILLISALMTFGLTAISPAHAADKYVEIGTGFAHSCGLTSVGDVYCWGNNEVGQLGRGTTGNPEFLPLKVPGLSNVISISVGMTHTCAIVKSKNVYCWGQNGNGKLGTGDLEQRNSPTLVKNIDNVKQISANRIATCAVVESGAAYCWGDNQAGQLGIGADEKAIVPTQVKNLSQVKQISISYMHACAVAGDGDLYCWGSNEYLEYGMAGQKSSATPVLVTGIPRVSKVSVGAGHTCVKTVDGVPYCWGYGERGQLGAGSSPKSALPAQVSNLKEIIDISAGRFHTCALTKSRTLVCWGASDTGQLGYGKLVDTNVPVDVLNLTNVQSLGVISAYASHSCAIVSTGNFTCWGLGTNGQLGNGTNVNSSSPSSASGASAGKDGANATLTIQIKCQKGKTTKTVTGISPKCPSGYIQLKEKAPSPVFYLDAKNGCYSLNYPVTEFANIKGNNKTLYSIPCTSPHHIEVFFSGTLKTAAANGLPTQAEVGAFCNQKYISAMGVPAPKQIAPNAIYLYWLFPDAGFEVRKYPRKVICSLFNSDNSYTYFVSVSKSLLRRAA